MKVKDKTLFEEGRRARKKSREEQEKIKENVERSLKAKSKEMILTLKLRFSTIVKELWKGEEELKKTGPYTELQHRVSLLYGMFLLLLLVIALAGETYLVRYTIAVFELGRAESLVAISIVIFGLLALESYLSHFERVHQEFYQKYMLYMSFGAVVPFLIGLYLLSDMRGALFSTQPVSLTGSLEEQLMAAERFLSTSGRYMGWVTKLFALVGMLSCGLCLHESVKRISISGLTLREYRRNRKLRKELQAIATEIIKWKYSCERGMRDFEAGLLSEEEEKPRRNWEAFLLSPIAILIIAILVIILLSTCTAKGAELESVYVLIDLSKSSLSQNYKGEEEAQKNVASVKGIIRRLKAGSNFKAIGVTEKSFEHPYIIIERTLPTEQGFFKEKLAKAKLELIRSWEELDLEANAEVTDLFGAISLAANLYPHNAKSKKLIILSDMRECARYDLEKPSIIDLKILSKVEEDGLIPSLKDVNVYVLGVHTVGKSEAYYETLKDFWLHYFQKAGANIVTYSMDRRWNNE